MLAISVMSFIFASGIGEGEFKNFNLWLFEHIPFWTIFRDTTKWLGPLAYVYAIFASLGVNCLIKKKWAVVLFLLPILYTYPMLGGFARQLKPVWYPDSWYEVNDILKQTKGCKALFFPWHLYYSLSFNNYLITASPAAKFFDCEIISSQNVELAGMQKEIWPDWSDPTQKIKYIIYTPDLAGVDIYDYSFIKSSKFKPMYQSENINLYEIQPK